MCRIIETRRWCVTFVTRINIIVEAESERMNVPRQESIAARNMQTKLHFATASFDRAPRSLLRERERESLMTNIRKQREAPVINIRPFDGKKEAVREDELTYRAKGWIEKSSVKNLCERSPLWNFELGSWIKSIWTISRGNLNFSREKDWKFCGWKWRRSFFFVSFRYFNRLPRYEESWNFFLCA